MSTKITLTPVEVGATFPAKWHGKFSGHPTPVEIKEKKGLVEEFMRGDLKDQVDNQKASPGFSLDFKWRKTSSDPAEYDLKVTAKKAGRHRNGQGADAAPTPKSPPPPPL